MRTSFPVWVTLGTESSARSSVKKFLTILLLVLCLSAQAGNKVKGYVIGFYNVENLYDIYDDPHTNDNDFLPDGKNSWTRAKYERKIHNIARVIRAMKEENGKYHAVLGLAEVENKDVLEDLVQDSQIADAKYSIVHYDSPDRRGIDVALLYRPDQFKLLDSQSIPFSFKGTQVPLTLDKAAMDYFKTRDILMVHGTIKGEHFAIYVCHLPSRQGGKNGQMRSVGAEIIYNHARAMEKKYPGIKVVVMGDMNDNPADESQSKWLHGREKLSDVGRADFFDPFWAMHKDGYGTEEYHGDWNIFDIIQVNYNLAAAPKGGLKIRPCTKGVHYGAVFVKDFMVQQSGKYKGTPDRTFSDHYPTYIVLK